MRNRALKSLIFDISAPSAHRVGRNVAAGMTGGLTYTRDEDDTLVQKASAITSSPKPVVTIISLDELTPTRINPTLQE